MRPGDRADLGGGELAQIQGVGVTGVAAVGGEEPEQRIRSTSDSTGWYRATAVVGVDMGSLQSWPETPATTQQAPPAGEAQRWLEDGPRVGVQLSDAAIVAVAGAS